MQKLIDFLEFHLDGTCKVKENNIKMHVKSISWTQFKNIGIVTTFHDIKDLNIKRSGTGVTIIIDY